MVWGLDGLTGDGLMQHADVMKMICVDLGIDHPVPVGQDVRAQPRKFAITQQSGERMRTKLDAITAENSQFDDTRFPVADTTSVQTEDWRYRYSELGSTLYRRSDETADRQREHPNVTARLEAAVQDWLTEHGTPVGDAGTVEFDRRSREQLRDLGYLQ